MRRTAFRSFKMTAVRSSMALRAFFCWWGVFVFGQSVFGNLRDGLLVACSNLEHALLNRNASEEVAGSWQAEAQSD
jgi:hypothetical protein